jgi:hypothetical protein
MQTPANLSSDVAASSFRGPMLAQGRGLARGVAGRAGGSAWVMLYKLPCSISLSAPAMTLSGIELSANGSIRP